jgi:hypothetical protein
MVNSSTNINKMNNLLSFQLMKQKRTTANVWIFVCFLFYHTITKQSTTLNNQWLKRKSDAGMKKTLRFIFSFRMWIFNKQRQSLQLYNCFYQRMTAFNKTSIFASQGLRFGSPFSPPLADLEYILKFARNATWWFIEVAPLR